MDGTDDSSRRKRTVGRGHPLVLDGGTGLLLQRIGVPIDPVLWSARALVEPQYHEKVIDAHRRFIDAGADVITTNNYSAIPHYLKNEGRADQYEALTQLAGKLASKARDGISKKVLVAGSIPPLGASFNAADVDPNIDDMVSTYSRIAKALDPNVDLFVCETLTSPQEAIAALTALKSHDKEVWLSFTVSEGDKEKGHLRCGATIEEALSKIGEPLLRSARVSTIMFNCSTPDAITSALRQFASSKSVPDFLALGCYPNGTEPISDNFLLHRDAPLHANDQLTDEKLADFVKQWLDLGVSIVGGCCRIFPSQIGVIRNTVDQHVLPPRKQ